MGFLDKIGDFVFGDTPAKRAGFKQGWADETYKRLQREDIAAAKLAAKKRENEAKLALKTKEYKERLKIAKIGKSGTIESAEIQADSREKVAQAKIIADHLLTQAESIRKSGIEFAKGIPLGTYSGNIDDHVNSEGEPRTFIAKSIVPYSRYIIKKDGNRVENPLYTKSMEGLKKLIAASKRNKLEINKWKNYSQAIQRFETARLDENKPYTGSFMQWMKDVEGQKSPLIQAYEKYEEEAKNKNIAKRDRMTFEQFWLSKSSASQTASQKRLNVDALKEYHKGNNKNIWMIVDGKYIKNDDGKKKINPILKKLIIDVHGTGATNRVRQYANAFHSQVKSNNHKVLKESQSVAYDMLPIIGELFENDVNQEKLFYGDNKFLGVEKFNHNQASSILLNIHKKIKNISEDKGGLEPSKNIIEFFTEKNSESKFTLQERKRFGKYYVDLVERIMQPTKTTLDSGIVQNVFYNLVEQMPNVHKVVQSLSPVIADKFSNYNSAVKSLAKVEVPSIQGDVVKTAFYTKIKNIAASRKLLKSVAHMQEFAEKNPFIEKKIKKVIKGESLSQKEYAEIAEFLEHENDPNWGGFEPLKDEFRNNPFMFIAYIEAAGFGNKEAKSDKQAISIENVRTLSKPVKKQENATYWQKVAKQRTAHVDIINVVKDMLVTANILNEGRPLSSGDTLFNAVNKIGGESALGTGSGLVKNIMNAFDALGSGFTTFASEFKSFDFQFNKLADSIEEKSKGKDGISRVNSEKFQSMVHNNLQNIREKYEKDVERDGDEKAARHRLGLRSILLFKKVALTYKLAGLVQGDQSGGRTISNQDYDQVFDALWSSGEVGNVANLTDLENDMELRIQKGDAINLLIELNGDTLGGSVDGAINTIFRNKREQFYKTSQGDNRESNLYNKMSVGNLTQQAGFLITGRINRGLKYEHTNSNDKLSGLVELIQLQMKDKNTASKDDIEKYIHSTEIILRNKAGRTFKYKTDREEKDQTSLTLVNLFESAAKIYGSKGPVNLDEKFLNREYLMEALEKIDFSNSSNAPTIREVSDKFIKNYFKNIISKIYPQK